MVNLWPPRLITPIVRSLDLLDCQEKAEHEHNAHVIDRTTFQFVQKRVKMDIFLFPRMPLSNGGELLPIPGRGHSNVRGVSGSSKNSRN